MSRLLHAAARGARIDVFYQCKWVSAIAVRTVDDLYNYRIHPDDEHLQYGPVSTALRKLAKTPNAYGTDWDRFLAEATINKFIGNSWEHKDSDYPLFYLILAEALADEGM